MEELVEQLTWVQLERHTKPVVIADIDGFWQPLLDLFAHMRERRFIQASFEVRYLVAEKIEDVVPMIETAAARTDLLGVRKEIRRSAIVNHYVSWIYQERSPLLIAAQRDARFSIAEMTLKAETDDHLIAPTETAPEPPRRRIHPDSGRRLIPTRFSSRS